MNKLMKFREVKFPPLGRADDDGVLAVSLDINCDALCSAYLKGIFPWPAEEEYILWFAPPERCVLDFEKFKVPARTLRYLKKDLFSFRSNTDFDSVIENCASVKRKGQPGTWITEKLMDAYKQFHREGQAWSFEAYNGDSVLVGGMYGVWINNYFSGESMFSTESNASKFVLINAVDFLKKNGVKWMDVQVLTPLLSMFGAANIPRHEFTDILNDALYPSIS